MLFCLRSFVARADLAAIPRHLYPLAAARGPSALRHGARLAATRTRRPRQERPRRQPRSVWCLLRLLVRGFACTNSYRPMSISCECAMAGPTASTTSCRSSRRPPANVFCAKSPRTKSAPPFDASFPTRAAKRSSRPTTKWRIASRSFVGRRRRWKTRETALRSTSRHHRHRQPQQQQQQPQHRHTTTRQAATASVATTSTRKAALPPASTALRTPVDSALCRVTPIVTPPPRPRRRCRCHRHAILITLSRRNCRCNFRIRCDRNCRPTTTPTLVAEKACRPRWTPPTKRRAQEEAAASCHRPRCRPRPMATPHRSPRRENQDTPVDSTLHHATQAQAQTLETRQTRPLATSRGGRHLPPPRVPRAPLPTIIISTGLALASLAPPTRMRAMMTSRPLGCDSAARATSHRRLPSRTPGAWATRRAEANCRRRRRR